MNNDAPNRFAATIDAMRPKQERGSPALEADECQCLTCQSDLRQIYPCLLEDEQP